MSTQIFKIKINVEVNSFFFFLTANVQTKQNENDVYNNFLYRLVPLGLPLTTLLDIYENKIKSFVLNNIYGTWQSYHIVFINFFISEYMKLLDTIVITFYKKFFTEILSL